MRSLQLYNISDDIVFKIVLFQVKIRYVSASIFLRVIGVTRTWFIFQFVFVAFLVKVFLIYSYSFVKYFFIGRDVAQPLVDTFRYILDYSRWMVGLTMYIIWLVVKFDEWLVCSSFQSWL